MATPAARSLSTSWPRAEVGAGLAKEGFGLERTATLAGGLGLVALGVARRSLATSALAMVGGVLVYRALSGRSTLPARDWVVVRRSVTIARPPEDVYRFWRHVGNLPRFMSHVVSVAPTAERRSHWVAETSLGLRVEWDAEITEDRPGELIAWRAVGEPSVEHAGYVRFTPAPREGATEVTVEITYRAPAAAAVSAAAEIFGRAPSNDVLEDLRRLRQLMETGEVPTAARRPTLGASR